MNHVVRSSLLLAVFFGLDKLVGLARQVIIGRTYGVGAELDAYNAANNLPDALFALISGGALAIAFIPVLSEYLEKRDRAAAWGLFSRVANSAFLITAVLAVLVALFAGPLVSRAIVPGFDSGQQALVVSLMRLNLIATLIFSISGLVIGGLQANQHFLLPALAPILYNLGQISGVTLLAPRLGIYGLAYGVILGAALHLGIQIPGLLRYGFKWTPRLEWGDPGVRRVARLMAPRVVTLVMINLIFIATDNFASSLGAGAVTAIAFGWQIMQVPETVIGAAIGTALLPTLSEQAARGDRAALSSMLRRALAAILVLTVPAAIVGLFVVRPFVALVFEGREFTAEGTALVTTAAQFFLLGLVGHSLVEVAARTFYAHQDALTPLVTKVATLGLFIGGCYLFIPLYAHGGIALANSVAFSLEAVVLLGLLWRRGVFRKLSERLGL